MRTCRVCGGESPKAAMVCTSCGLSFALTESLAEADRGASAEVEALEAHERLEREHGIDIGERTIEEYLADLNQRDYSRNAWYWSIVALEVAWVGLVGAAEIGLQSGEIYPWLAAISALLPVAILLDTYAVGQFDRWSKVRWTYVLTAVVPLFGQIAGGLYLLGRHLYHQEAEEHWRTLVEFAHDLGVDVDAAFAPVESD